VNDIQSSTQPSLSQLKLLRLGDAACEDPALVGSKTAALARLYHVLPGTVPPGVAVPIQHAALFMHVTGDSYTEVSQALLAALGEPNQTTTRQYAVRSSALDEDSASHSFAGQYETALGLVTAHDIIDAIGACVRSAASVRVAAYRHAAAQAPGGTLGVLIQEMVPADRAGVAFTANPLSGENEVVINAAFGLGDLLVGGEITPDEFIAESSGRVSKRTIGSKQMMSILTRNGIIHAPVPEALQMTSCLSDDQIRSIVMAARGCQEALGYPIDMEWALSGKSLFVLQARPITAISTGAKLT
jgi:phosphoenolpyruvate synthase/pyruvate phosphate dikinase